MHATQINAMIQLLYALDQIIEDARGCLLDLGASCVCHTRCTLVLHSAFCCATAVNSCEDEPAK